MNDIMTIAVNDTTIVDSLRWSVRAIAQNTTADFFMDDVNVMAIFALAVAIFAACFGVLQWKATQSVRNEMQRQAVNNRIAEYYLPELTKYIYMTMVKTMAVNLRLQAAGEQHTLTFPEEDLIEKIQYDTNYASFICDNFITKCSKKCKAGSEEKTRILVGDVNSLKRQFLMHNAFVEMARKHIADANISLATKLEDLRVLIAYQTELIGIIKNVMDHSELDDSEEITAANTKSIIEFIVKGHEYVQKMPTNMDCDIDETALSELCRSLRRNGSTKLWYEIYKRKDGATADKNEEKLYQMIKDDAKRYYTVLRMVQRNE